MTLAASKKPLHRAGRLKPAEALSRRNHCPRRHRRGTKDMAHVEGKPSPALQQWAKVATWS